MTKRDVTSEFAGLVNAVLRDCVANYPQDHLDFMRDSKRVSQNAVDRGTSFFTKDLPALSDWLYQSLAQGRLILGPRPPSGRAKSKDDTRPRIFWTLWSRLFDSRGLLLEDGDPTALFLLNTLCLVWKKVEVPVKPSATRKAFTEFFAIEAAMTPAPRFWESASLDIGDDLGFLTDVLLMHDSAMRDRQLLEDCQRISGTLVSEIGFIVTDEIVGRHGPGAVSDRNSKEDKYLFPSWPRRLEAVFPLDIHGSLNWNSEFLRERPLYDLDGLDEPASFLECVPKDAKGPRLIAEEPTCNQWIQQGISDILRKRVGMSRLGMSIDFFDQTPSQEACLRASKGGDYATIDLSSASDRMSCWLVQRVFRSNYHLLRMLAASRTRFLVQDKVSFLPKVSHLRKFASMGSALTFPVQSIVFASLAIGVGSHLHPERKLDDICKEVRVFGDDIIVPSTWVVTLTRVLTLLGLKVNDNKSFSTGEIRESCGVHAWRGYDVTPFRMRRPLRRADGASQLTWMQAVSNAFLKGLWHTSTYIESRLGVNNVPVVPPYAPQIGFRTFCSGMAPTNKLVWNRYYQRYEVIGVGFKIKSITEQPDDGINCLLRLGRAHYPSERDLILFGPPRRKAVRHELLEAVDGPAIKCRVRAQAWE